MNSPGKKEALAALGLGIVLAAAAAPAGAHDRAGSQQCNPLQANALRRDFGVVSGVKHAWKELRRRGGRRPHLSVARPLPGRARPSCDGGRRKKTPDPGSGGARWRVVDGRSAAAKMGE